MIDKKCPVIFVTADGLRGVRDMPSVHERVPLVPLVIDFKITSRGLGMSVRRYVFSCKDSTLISRPYVLVYVEEVR